MTLQHYLATYQTINGTEFVAFQTKSKDLVNVFIDKYVKQQNHIFLYIYRLLERIQSF